MVCAGVSVGSGGFESCSWNVTHIVMPVVPFARCADGARRRSVNSVKISVTRGEVRHPFWPAQRVAPRAPRQTELLHERRVLLRLEQPVAVRHGVRTAVLESVRVGERGE